MQLQNWIDIGITRYVGELEGSTDVHVDAWTWDLVKGLSPSPGSLLPPPRPSRVRNELECAARCIGYFVFPTEKFETDGWWLTGQYILPYFLLMAFIYPMTQVTSYLVVEKSTKIKEGMKMMGASTAAFWTSWIIWFLVLFTLIAVICTIIAVVGDVFKYSDSGIMFLWIWVYCLSTASFG